MTDAEILAVLERYSKEIQPITARPVWHKDGDTLFEAALNAVLAVGEKQASAKAGKSVGSQAPGASRQGGEAERVAGD